MRKLGTQVMQDDINVC